MEMIEVEYAGRIYWGFWVEGGIYIPELNFVMPVKVAA
jgi:hypothetical protein